MYRIPSIRWPGCLCNIAKGALRRMIVLLSISVLPGESEKVINVVAPILYASPVCCLFTPHIFIHIYLCIIHHWEMIIMRNTDCRC